jgi:hypothetical protein
MGDYPNISQIMLKYIPYIHSMFRNFAAIALELVQVISYSGFYTLPL